MPAIKVIWLSLPDVSLIYGFINFTLSSRWRPIPPRQIYHGAASAIIKNADSRDNGNNDKWSNDDAAVKWKRCDAGIFTKLRVHKVGRLVMTIVKGTVYKIA